MLYYAYFACLLTRLCFSWLNPLVWLGWKRKIQIEDIPKVLDGDSSKLLGDKLQSAWNIEKKKRNAKFIHAYFAVFGKEFFWSGILYCFVECFVRYGSKFHMKSSNTYIHFKIALNWQNYATGLNELANYELPRGQNEC